MAETGNKIEPIKFKEEKPGAGIPFMTLASAAAMQAHASPLLSDQIKICSAEEVALWDIPFRILIWGAPNSGKTHFALTFPEPICIVDTEGRYPLIIKKFRVCKDCGNDWVSSDMNPKTMKPVGILECPSCGSKNVRLKDIRGIRCKSGAQAQKAADMFLKILDDHHNKTGEIGTIVVDNASKIWDWNQSEYSIKKYGSEPSDTHLDPMGDYKFINPQHNEYFRDKILGSIHNVVMIATMKAQYSKDDRYKIIGSGADGQKHNPFAVDWTIINAEGEVVGTDGQVVGNGIYTSHIQKNSLISGKIPPQQSLDYKKLVKIRQSLMVICGVVEDKDDKVKV